MAFAMDLEVEFGIKCIRESILWEQSEFKDIFLVTKTLETSFGGVVELTRLNSYHMPLQFNTFLKLMTAFYFFFFLCLLQCAALVGEDQPLCPDLPELDLSELDVNDLDTDSFLGGLKWCSDQSEIISNQYNNEPSNIFEVRTLLVKINFSLNLAWAGLT